jgi:hypothetical protein
MGPVLSQAVSRLPLTAKFRVNLRSVHVTFVVDRVAVGLVFLRLLQFCRKTIIPPILHTHISIIYSRRYITLPTDNVVK